MIKHTAPIQPPGYRFARRPPFGRDLDALPPADRRRQL
jgi:hypothetical protein